MSEEVTDLDEWKCLRCRHQMVYLGQLPLRTGGISGYWSQFGEAFEKIIELYTYRCSNCRIVEFYDLDSKLPTPPQEPKEQEWE